MIFPFYLFEEKLPKKDNFSFNRVYAKYDTGFLKRDNMKEISIMPGRDVSEDTLLARLKEGQLCFGLKHKESIVAFNWCDLDGYHSRYYPITLNNNEAYLYDAYTLPSFRGRGIASFLRYQLYKELVKLGKTRFYSLSQCFNMPAIRFKQKLNARLCKLVVYCKIFNKYQLRMVLKKY
jgi:ribosomal protein S18 acetylase RimI-like enzyme